MDGLYDIVRRIVEEKRAQKQEPAIAHFRELIDLLPDAPAEWETALHRLQDIGLIHIGPTIRGDYARPSDLSLVTDDEEKQCILSRAYVVALKNNPNLKF